MEQRRSKRSKGGERGAKAEQEEQRRSKRSKGGVRGAKVEQEKQPRARCFYLLDINKKERDW